MLACVRDEEKKITVLQKRTARRLRLSLHVNWGCPLIYSGRQNTARLHFDTSSVLPLACVYAVPPPLTVFIIKMSFEPSSSSVARRNSRRRAGAAAGRAASERASVNIIKYNAIIYHKYCNIYSNNNYKCRL